jgi:hypothetical protein
MKELGLELEPALIYFLELELEVLYKSQDCPTLVILLLISKRYLPAGCIPD